MKKLKKTKSERNEKEEQENKWNLLFPCFTVLCSSKENIFKVEMQRGRREGNLTFASGENEPTECNEFQNGK